MNNFSKRSFDLYLIKKSNKYLKNPKPNYHDYLILFGIFLVFFIFNLIWFLRDNLPPHLDMTAHLSHAWEYYNILKNGNILNFLFKYYSYYPPLIYQLTAIFYLVAGQSIWITRSIILIFYFLIYFFTYLIGKKIFSRTTGITAALITLFLPINYIFSRDYLLDIPLTAWVLLTLYFLLQNPFTEKNKSIILGILLGCGFLIKWTFGAFIFGPIIFLILKPIFSISYSDPSAEQSVKQIRENRLINIVFTLFFAALIACPWYLTNIFNFFRDAYQNANIIPLVEKDPIPESVQYFLYYFEIILNEYLYLPLFLLIIFGIYKLIKSKQISIIFYFFSILIPVYIIFTAIQNKDPRYIFPIIPFFSILISYGIITINKFWKKILFFIFILGYLGIQFLGSIFNLGYLSNKIAIPSLNRYIVFYHPEPPPIYFQENSAWISSVLGEWVLYNPFSYFGRLPRKEDWHIEEIAKQVSDQDKVFIDVDNDVYFNKGLLEYFIQTDRNTPWPVPTQAEADISITKYPVDCKQEAISQYILPNKKEIFVCKK